MAFVAVLLVLVGVVVCIAAKCRHLIKIFIAHLGEPLNSIKRHPYQFVVWWLVANVFGLAGFLLPILFCWARGKDTYALFLTSVNSGNLASFSVVLLADGIASILVVVGAGKNPIAAGIRGLVSLLAFGIAMIQVGLLVVQSSITDGSLPSVRFQLALTVISIICATYLYCFRSGDWEDGVEVVRQEDDQAVFMLEKSASSKTEDEGVKL